MTERRGSAHSSYSVFSTAVLVSVVVALALLVWRLADVLLVGFAAILFAIVLRVLACVAAVYLAAQPERHRAGALMLIPQALRDKVGSAFDNAGRALRLWLFGQLVSMMVVGVLATVGLYLIGMPSAPALGFLAGVSEFVPLVGPALAAIPAILVALSEGGATIFWVLGLYLAIQQLENNIIMPLVHRRTVELPPVVTLFAIPCSSTASCASRCIRRAWR